MAKRPELMIVGGELAGRRFEVKPGGVRLGRSSSNDIHVPDEELSRNHCFFEPVGDDGIRLTDLASANGTLVNGVPLGVDPAMLKVGDLIEVGRTVLKVVGEDATPAPVSVDLGLGGNAARGGESAAPAGASAAKKRSPLSYVLWAVAALAVVGAAVVMMLPQPVEEQPKPVDEVEPENPPVEELYYEKVSADSKGIFRYELRYAQDGILRVAVDDVPAENRHLVKGQPLDEAAKAELNEILSLARFKELDREYVGVEPDPPALESWTLRVVYSTRARTVKVVNVQEPEAFRTIREKLEAFSKNQLGVWALQYSRDKLVSLAEEAVRLGDTKWEDRDVRHGNLYESVQAYKEAIFYLETVNPKPGCHAAARKNLERSQEELDRRFKDQRFLADRAINLTQWETAQRELQILVEMVPDRADDRNREASAKLVDVEKRLKGGK